MPSRPARPSSASCARSSAPPSAARASPISCLPAARRRPPALRADRLNGFAARRSLPLASAAGRSHQLRRDLFRELLDPAFGGMHAELQAVEVRLAVRPSPSARRRARTLRLQLAEAGDDLGEVAVQQVPALRIDRDVLAVAEGQAAIAVPFRLVEPALALGDRQLQR
jgi:hypothetical protein